MKVGKKTFKVHLDGYNLLPAAEQGPRRRARNSSTGTTTARWWACVTTTGRSCSRSSVPKAWTSGRTRSQTLRLPKLFNLRSDPFERADKLVWAIDSGGIDRAFLLVPAQDYVARFIQTLAEFPPRQKPGSFNLQGVLDKLTRPPEGVN